MLDNKTHTLLTLIHVGSYTKTAKVLSLTQPAVSHQVKQLEQEYGIMTRVGLHCAPLAHKSLGTFPEGTVRFSIGPFNTEEEIDTAIEAIRKYAQESNE